MKIRLFHDVVSKDRKIWSAGQVIEVSPNYASQLINMNMGVEVEDTPIETAEQKRGAETTELPRARRKK